MHDDGDDDGKACCGFWRRCGAYRRTDGRTGNKKHAHNTRRQADRLTDKETISRPTGREENFDQNKRSRKRLAGMLEKFWWVGRP